MVRRRGDRWVAEPHYLLTAEALARHGILDLADAYEHGRYRPFHDAPLSPQGAPDADGRLVAPHDPLLPALLALPMRAGGWAAAKATLALLARALAAAAGLYVAAHLAWYGGLTVYAAGEFFQGHGGEATVVGTDPEYLGRSVRLVGLLLDPKFRLAAWQRAWLLLVPAAAALFAVRAWGPAGGVRAAVLAPLAAGWLVATWPLPVVWLAALVALTWWGWHTGRTPRRDAGRGAPTFTDG